MTKILFEITDDSLETGLRGIPVGYCTTSKVDPETGLHYRGKAVREFAHLDPEEVIYCLLEGKLEGKTPEFLAFKKELERRAKLHPAVKDHICKLPRQCHPMKLLASAFLIMSAFEKGKNYQEDCLNIIAKVPEIAAIIINYHGGFGDTPESKPELGYMENFCHMLKVPHLSNQEVLKEVMRLFNILHYDHGGGNLSTFVGKAVASGLEDMYGSLAASICALEGAIHGRANQVCLQFLQEVRKQVGDQPTGETIETLIENRLAKGELVFGFGHAVLRKEDTRATLLAEIANKYFRNDPLVKIGLLLRERVPKILMKNPKIQNPYANVDLLSGAVLSAAGFPYPEYFTVLFGLSRTIGIARQIVYERCEARGGKGTPIVRPKYLYKAA